MDVIESIKQERQSQVQKWGVQNHSPLEWLSILGEEFGEVSKAICEAHFHDRFYPNGETWDDVKRELVQVAAVCVAMIESMERNGYVKEI